MDANVFLFFLFHRLLQSRGEGGAKVPDFLPRIQFVPEVVEDGAEFFIAEKPKEETKWGGGTGGLVVLM